MYYYMAKLTLADIQKVARLSRIDLTEKEIEQMTTEVSSILEFVDTLQAVETEGVPETSQVTGLQDVWREDIVKNCEIPREKLLANAPDTQDGYIKVKKVL